MRKPLCDARVWRAGRTARSSSVEDTKVNIFTIKEEVRLGFSLSSKGGGITEVMVAIGPKDFAAVALAMFVADRETAMIELSRALAGEVAKQPDCDRRMARLGRNSVMSAAQRAYVRAPKDHNHGEKLTLDMVRQLVSKLNSEEPESEEENSAA